MRFSMINFDRSLLYYKIYHQQYLLTILLKDDINMKKINLFLIVTGLLIGALSCTEDDEPNNGTHSHVNENNTTNLILKSDVSYVGALYAQISVIVNFDYIASFRSIGVEFSTQPTLQDNQNVIATERLTNRTVSVRTAVLFPETKYYYRAFVTTSDSTYYGELKSFTTKKTTEMTEHDMYVDLGLPSGTLWATMNVGANSPEEYGDYFAWGETTPKDNYNWNTYKWSQGCYVITKYNISLSYSHGSPDSKGELELSDDAAYVNWGPSWRMPTVFQMQELIDNCKRQLMMINNVYGCLYISKINGASLFLPASLYRYDNNSDIYDGNTWGYYWSRTLKHDSPQYAYYLEFYRNFSHIEIYMDSYTTSGDFGSGSDPWSRCSGKTVRAVRIS